MIHSSVSGAIGRTPMAELQRVGRHAGCRILVKLENLNPGAQVLFTFCSELYERVAMIVTTNLKFADWTQLFGDERLTAALLDRLTHHAHILELVGESYRFRQRMEQEVG